jgi:hypothetical protein
VGKIKKESIKGYDMKSIYEFKKGDEIVRITPAKPLKNLLGEIRDRSFLGEKMIFAGIANGQIYLRRTKKIDLKIFGNGLLDLSLDIWDDGWDYYVDPENLLADILPRELLEDKLNKAVEEEDYILAERLRKLLEKKGG